CGVTPRAAVLFRAAFVARSLQTAEGYAPVPVRKHLAPRQHEKFLAAHVTIIPCHSTSWPRLLLNSLSRWPCLPCRKSGDFGTGMGNIDAAPQPMHLRRRGAKVPAQLPGRPAKKQHVLCRPRQRLKDVE